MTRDYGFFLKDILKALDDMAGFIIHGIEDGIGCDGSDQ
jgi:hypothetical protein